MKVHSYCVELGIAGLIVSRQDHSHAIACPCWMIINFIQLLGIKYSYMHMYTKFTHPFQDIILLINNMNNKRLNQLYFKLTLSKLYDMTLRYV